MSLVKISDRVLNLEASATLAMAAKAKELKDKGVPVVSLGAGEPDFETPQIIINAAKAALDKGVNKYTPVRGTDELVHSIQTKIKNSLGLSYYANQIISSPGVKGTLSLAIDALVNHGDEVILLSPYWVTYPAQVRLAGGIPVVVSGKIENNYIPDIGDFKNAISSKTKAVLLNTPNNPAGYVMSKDYLTKMMKVLEGTSVCVLSDEIYEHLLFDGREHVSAATLSSDAYNRTLVLIGVAKGYAMTGWRVGVAAGPKELVAAMVKLQGQRYSCITSVAQSAAAFAFLESAPVKDAIAKMKDAYLARRCLLEELVAGLPEVSWCKPEGTFFALLDFSGWINKEHKGAKIQNDIDLATRLLVEAHVAIVPGSPFGAPNTVRVSLSSSPANIIEGLKRIRVWLDS